MDLVRDLLAFVDAGPSPAHVAAEMGRRLEKAGFSLLDERQRWKLEAGDQRYVVRDGGSVIAFRVGSASPSDRGLRLVGAHTDSPALRVRPRPDLIRHGYRQIGVEPYGGLLLHTWLDRDLTLAGRIAVRSADGGIEMRLVRLQGAPLRIPSLAIHLDRTIRSEGLQLDPQRHMAPVWATTGDGSEPDLLSAIAEELGCPADAILGHELVAADTQPPALGGAEEEFVFAPRLDNLLSCHLGLHSLASAPRAEVTQILICNDHEEAGSTSAEGAAGSFLEDALRRIVSALEGADPQAFAMTTARSWLVSADAAHAVHPNFAERHDAEHQPRLGGGPVLKSNANQSYASDAGSSAWFFARCADAGVPMQHFVTRADLPCGSTIGPLTAARLGIQTVDAGAPLLSMHSIREQVAADDLEALASALGAHYQAPAGE
ncbi:MAG TPA: M18 family aminopeptidase [Egibacteraceae bacterium]|nr:M18 family aminopeptidase [Egibacteraceae bacterium]